MFMLRTMKAMSLASTASKKIRGSVEKGLTKMLRIRTGYSFRAATGHFAEVIARLQEVGASVAPITDRAATFGWTRWAKACKAADLRPVFGVELAVSPEIGGKKPLVDHWLFIARGTVAPINALLALATQQFHYQPTLTVEQALEAAAELTVVTGHRPMLDWSKPVDGVFVGLGPATRRATVRQALEAGWPLAATGDNRFTNEGDRGFYEVLTGRNAESQTYAQHILSEEEWLEAVSGLGLGQEVLTQALLNADDILDRSRASLLKATLPEPARKETLLRMCHYGARKLKLDLKQPDYAERLKKELTLIAEKGYEDYFYIVADLCQWARKTMIVGPARGSSCGSLVCYLLGITTVDPLPHGLIFERFIDINRNDMPDIDIDFSDQQRYQVFDYLGKKYGADRVARLGTVAMFHPRSALKEVGTALRIPQFRCDAVAESLIERSSGDSRALDTLADTLQTMPAGKVLLEEHPEAIVACRFEGHPRHYSQHAAGVVLAAEPIVNYVAIDHRTGATMCDKKDAEEGFNLLKIDCLGLTQLSVFEDALELAGLPQSTLDKLPLDDPEAFKVLNDAKFSGIFQFNGMALQSIVKQFTVDCFADIVSVTALARPGPLASGGAHEWVRRRNGTSPVTFAHDCFKPYIASSYGIILYQEQVMEIGRNIGDLTWGQVSELRKAMSKSLGKEYFDKFGDPWKLGAIARGVTPADAEKVWSDLCSYGAMGFNKSHAVAYGLISYWCCWLKAHHPFEFAAATLTHEVDPMRMIQTLREMMDEGFDYVPVDLERSTDKWTVATINGKRKLVGPLSIVDGIGPKMMAQVMDARKKKLRMPARAEKLLTNARTPIDTLWPIRDAFHTLLPDPREANIISPRTAVKDLRPEYEDTTVVLFCTLAKINPRDENEIIMVARRNGQVITDGLTNSLNLQLMDDTDTIFGKINRFKYPELGPEIVDRGRVGKALYAVKGRLKGHRGRGETQFRMVSVDQVKYIGDIDAAFGRKVRVKQEGGGTNVKLQAGEQVA